MKIHLSKTEVARAVQHYIAAKNKRKTDSVVVRVHTRGTATVMLVPPPPPPGTGLAGDG